LGGTGTLTTQGTSSYIYSSTVDINGTKPWVNQGEFRVQGVNSNARVYTPFSNAGTVKLLVGGMASLEGGGTHTGNFDIASGSTLSFSGGTHSLGSATSFTGAGRVRLTQGALNADQAITLAADAPLLEVSGGTLGGAGAVTINGAFNVTGDATISGARTVSTRAQALTSSSRVE
jgi:hypothetical protein